MRDQRENNAAVDVMFQVRLLSSPTSFYMETAMERYDMSCCLVDLRPRASQREGKFNVTCAIPLPLAQTRLGIQDATLLRHLPRTRIHVYAGWQAVSLYDSAYLARSHYCTYLHICPPLPQHNGVRRSPFPPECPP